MRASTALYRVGFGIEFWLILGWVSGLWGLVPALGMAWFGMVWPFGPDGWTSVSWLAR